MLKNCSICGREFETNLTRQNVCGYDCRMERNRQNALRYKRDASGARTSPPCAVCGFPISEAHHEGYGKVYSLCPNHHAAITRGRATLAEVLAGWNG